MRQHTSRLLNDGWRFRELQPATLPNTANDQWLPANVPGHVHLDLMRLGVIPDPFKRMYERTVQWVDEVDWVYTRTLVVEAEELEGARHLIRFGGLDTVARVLVNDVVVGEPENMFVPHTFDVTDILRAGTNSLEVQFTSAQRVGEERMASFLEQPDYTGIDSYRRGLMARSFIRKAQYMYGWDWGPRLRSCGIWQNVELLRVPVARIRDWSYATDFTEDGGCRVTLQVYSDGQSTSPLRAAASLAGGEESVAAEEDVVDGVATITLDLRAAQRWWPTGYGNPTLYDLHMTLSSGDDIVDQQSARIGLREVELVREADDAGESFFFRINGVPIFCKGANWIPADSFPARITPERYRDHILLARDASMNMLRIWGGGLYETDDFYTNCDELGMMVWQDFPFACALYPDDEPYASAMRDEAIAAIRRLRHYPSLVLYCGNNENQMGAVGGWWGALPRCLGDRFYEEILPAAVAAEDPTRPYWPGSPYGGDNPNDETRGDCHYWNVWHGAGDWIYYADCTSRFVSEFGFAAPPAQATLEEATNPIDRGVDTLVMRWHDKTSKGYDTYLGFIALHYPMPTTLPDLAYYGQLNQAEGMKFGIEHFRRLRPHTMGTLVWQLNDCWPVQSWAWLDYTMQPKAAWYYAKRFYAPLLVSIARNDAQIDVHLVNDRLAEATGTLTVRAITADGSELWRHSGPASVGPNTNAVVIQAELPTEVLEAADHTIIHAAFAPTTPDNEQVENTILLVEPKDMRVSAPQLEVTVLPATASGALRCVLQSRNLALSVMLSLDGVDATWSDNFVHLLPGEMRTLEVEPVTPLTPDEARARLRWRSL